MSENKKILVINLDGTLVKSDMLYETFWSAFEKNLFIPLISICKLFFGKSHIKNFLANNANFDVETLPYNKIVIDYIQRHKSQGGKVALVSSSAELVALKISKHINLFDEVYASSKQIKLNGINKALFLNQRYGIRKYDYLGNSLEDIQIWKYSNKAITIDASRYLEKKCYEINQKCFHLKSENRVNDIKAFFIAIRPYQWLKNILIFLPIIAAHNINNIVILDAILAFISFSFTASSVYLINDLLDLKSDRNHPHKNKRPFASGDLPMQMGHILGLATLLLGIICALKLGLNFLSVLFLYFLITIFYSIYFKKRTIIDIFILSLLYTIRIIGGGVATNIDVSFWLLAFAIFIFLSLAAIKRQSELVDLLKRGKSEIVGRGYNVQDLNFISSFALSAGLLSNLVLILYINSPKVFSLYPNPEFLWFSCFLFLFWIVRICFKTNRGEMNYDPIIFSIKDNISISIFVLIVIFVILSNKIW